jgi:hypothetical protein
VEKDPKTGKDMFIQENFESVLAIPYDMPIVGYNNNLVHFASGMRRQSQTSIWIHLTVENIKKL